MKTCNLGKLCESAFTKPLSRVIVICNYCVLVSMNCSINKTFYFGQCIKRIAEERFVYVLVASEHGDYSTANENRFTASRKLLIILFFNLIV